MRSRNCGGVARPRSARGTCSVRIASRIIAGDLVGCDAGRGEVDAAPARRTRRRRRSCRRARRAGCARTSPMRVATALGTTTDTPIGAPIAARSCARHSLAASAANFETLYGAVNGVEHMPAIDTVLTMCAGRLRGEHPRHEGPDAVQDAPQVDAERPLEVARPAAPRSARPRTRPRCCRARRPCRTSRRRGRPARRRRRRATRR